MAYCTALAYRDRDDFTSVAVGVGVVGRRGAVKFEATPFGPRPRRRRLTWRMSLAMLIVPLVALLATTGYVVFLRDDRLRVTVIDAYSELPLGSVRVSDGRETAVTDDRGQTRLELVTPARVTFAKEDYDPVTLEVAEGLRSITVRLRPNVVRGVVTNRANGQPLAGVAVKALLGDRVVAEARTGPDGQYTLREVPEGATLAFEHDEFSDVQVKLSRQTSVSVALRRDVVTGRVTDLHGDPIPDATIVIGNAISSTDETGAFRLAGAPEEGDVVVKASGYRAIVLPLTAEMRVEAQLEPISVRAIYINAAVAANPEALAERLALAERTEINAVVVDLKDSTGRVYYDSQVPLARAIGATLPVLQPAALIEELHRRNIYAIARIVVFEDPILAEAKPEWAIKNAETGGLWRTWNGLAWVNAHRSEVWDYNIALALEAARFGFDEIQFDYVRFPSDGPLDQAEYGVEHTRVTRTHAIGEFLARARQALAPTRAYLAADIFGLQLWELGDSGIGQNLEIIAQHVDYICPMVYPSHFYPGSMGFDIPNDHPYEVVLWSLQNGMERLSQQSRKLRPWLQDFSYGRGIEYGPNQVRAQIQAVLDAGLDSWMLWNADNVYHEQALQAD